MVKNFLAVLAMITISLASSSFADIGDRDWAAALVNKYPELTWLAQKDVRVTQEGTSSSQPGKLSEALFGSSYDEFDRTLHTLKDLHLLLDGSEAAYKQFTEGQKLEERLSYRSFQEAGEVARNLIKQDPQIKEAMIMALIFGDMGKTIEARKLASIYGINEPDHDQFLHQVLEKCPEIFPSYNSLSPEVRSWIRKELPIHLGHVTHLEGGPEMLDRLKQSGIAKNSPDVIDFFLFVHTCDVAGALAHVNSKGSLTYTENTHKVMKALSETLKLLADKEPEDVLSYYISERAKWLGLNPTLKEDRILTRIGCMLRFFRPEDGQALKKSYSETATYNQRFIEQNFEPLMRHVGRTPTYVPAVLLNLKNNIQWKTNETRLTGVLNEGLPFILIVMRDYYSALEGGIPIKEEENQFRTIAPVDLEKLTVCFNPVAKQAKETPEILQHNRYRIDAEGNVTAVEED